jgi:mono/diheme cytochrome c family protein
VAERLPVVPPRPSLLLETLLSLAILTFFYSSSASATTVPGDDLSLLNGAEYFEEHCTECHGWNPNDQYTSLYTVDPEEEQQEQQLIDELIATVQDPADKVKTPLEKEEEDWPEWAGPPPEKTQTEMQALEAAIVEDFNRAIDEVYGGQTRLYGWEDGVDEYHYEDRDTAFEESLHKIYDSNLDRNPDATDLLDPESFLYGTGEVELYSNIAYGTGSTMPGFLETLGSEEAIWDLVNYIQSLWGVGYVEYEEYEE